MSMDFYASKQESEGCYGPVFGFEDGDETSLNVSNSNAQRLVEALGYKFDEETFFVPIDEFIERATKWLDANPLPSPMTPHVIDEAPGRATFTHFGLPAGYFQRQIGRLLDLAVQGKKAEATHVFAG